MKEQVFEAIQKSGEDGIRLRDIGAYCHYWHCKCLDWVVELLNEGRIYGKTIGTGVEAYIKYYVK